MANGIPLIDFSALASLPDSYMAGRQIARQRALEQQFSNGLPRGADGMIDFGAAAELAARSGNLSAMRDFATLAQAQSDRAFERDVKRQQLGFEGRRTALAEKQAEEKPQYMKDEAGNIIQIDPYGRGAKVLTPTGTPPQANPFFSGNQTEGQANASLYANRMFAAEKTLRDVEKVGTYWTEVAKSKVPLFGNYLVSQDYQKLDQAKRDFVNSVLRRESGAVISESEFANANKQYFPQPGDSAETIAQKRRNRVEAIRGIAAAGGRNYRPPYNLDPSGTMTDRPRPSQGNVSAQDALTQARDAIARGANPAEVRQRLQSLGFDALGL